MMSLAAGRETLRRMAGDRTQAVYLVRHAFAAHADSARWPDDAKRPLTEDGIRRFRAAARGLRQLVPAVDVMLSSGYTRAWQTAELLHEVTRWPKPQECRALEAGRPAAAALDVLRERTESSVALVGHEPYLSTLASILCAGGEGELRLELKKGAVALLQLEDGSSRTAWLGWVVSPSILRAVGRAPR